MDCSPPGSSVHGIVQARILELPLLPQGIFLTQELNLCFLHFLHWQADSLPLSLTRKPCGGRSQENKMAPKGNAWYIVLILRLINLVHCGPFMAHRHTHTQTHTHTQNSRKMVFPQDAEYLFRGMI